MTNMPKQKKTVIQYCDGCLSTDRILTQINTYRDIYLKIMREDLKKSNRNLNEDLLMCWECLANLRNAKKFIQTVKKAQLFLSTYNVRKPATISCSLSNLTTNINTEQILLIYNEETHTNEAKTENNYTPFDVVKEENETELDEEVKVVKDLKEEPSANLEIYHKPEFHIDPSQNIDDYSIKEEVDNISYIKSNSVIDEKEDVKIPNNVQLNVVQEKSMKDNDTKNEMKIQKHASLKLKYKIVFLKKDEKNKMDVFYKKINNLSEIEMQKWKKQDVNARNYKARPYKCVLCFQGFKQHSSYQQHLKKWHSESSGNFQCDICNKRFSVKDTLACHVRGHYSKYRCLLCAHETYHMWQIYSHHDTAHRRVVLCSICGMKFEKRADCYKHYTDLHSRLICDYCGKAKSTRQWLIRHIRRHHAPHRCDVCARLYSSSTTLAIHKVVVHLKAPTEDAYCVECDKQFDNVTLYRRHVKTSTRHVTVAGIPCPECGKLYKKKCAMTNHFHHVHLKKTKHHCVECSRYFLNGFQYRRHVASFHDKIPAKKNKICPHCERAFSTNRILVNHIRTHTGERPFVCELCSASFAQKNALVTHRRSVHRVESKSRPVSKT